MVYVSPFGLPLGISITFWTIIGLIRLVTTTILSYTNKKGTRKIPKPSDIAVLLPAHNEEVVVRDSIRALANLVDRKQIYVVSDGSHDKTHRRAKMENCHVSELTPSRGKAKAMLYLIRKYHLFERYKLIFIVDADTRIDKNFLNKALPFFEDPKVGAVFATARITWPPHIIPRLKYYFIAYRERLNRMLQYFMIYGQTWKYTNAPYVIPGFATIYRSKILSQLEMDTPGILIEDFNLALQFYKKRLGRVGYSPGIIGWDQHPDNLKDYWSQVRRWNIGFFQSVRKNGIWPSFFWLALGIFTIEVFLHSIFLVLLPLAIFSLLIPVLPFTNEILDGYRSFYQTFGFYNDLTLIDIFIFIFLFDYIMTVVIGLITKKPMFAFYGIFFFFMHYVTSMILLSSLIPGFLSSSKGRWSSPTRRAEAATP